MKLPLSVLKGMAAAAACITVAGCDWTAKTPPPEQPAYNESGDPTALPNQQPGKVCLPDSCPACGRG